MTDMLQEFCDSRGVVMRVDRQAGVIRGVKVLGLESRNGRSYLPEALAQAAPLYEEAKVNVNHPRGNPGGPRDYQDRIGTVRNVGLRAGEGLFADFHFNPKHALAEQLIWDAEHAPENVGFSHNVEARCGRRGDRVVVEAITRVQSVDLVADPATTRGLFESQQTSALPNTEVACGDRDDELEHEATEETEKQGAETSVASVSSCNRSESDRLREEIEATSGAGSDAAKGKHCAAAAAGVRPARGGCGRSLGQDRQQPTVSGDAPGRGRRAGHAGAGRGPGTAGADALRRPAAAGPRRTPPAVPRSAPRLRRRTIERQEFRGGDYLSEWSGLRVQARPQL